MSTTVIDQNQVNDSVWMELVENAREIDFVLILIPPALMTAVFLLPQQIQGSLVLDYGRPTITGLWTSAFVHNGFKHFINNLMTALLAIPAYALFVLSNERKLFRNIWISFLTVVPVVISIIGVVAISQGNSAGFSGIGSAIFGLLPISLCIFCHKRISSQINLNTALVLFLIAAGLIAMTYMGPLSGTGIFLIAGAMAVNELRKVGVQESKNIASIILSDQTVFVLVLFTGLMFIASPMVLFPSNLTQNGSVVNIFSHYLGLVIGFFGPATYLICRGRRR